MESSGFTRIGFRRLGTSPGGTSGGASVPLGTAGSVAFYGAGGLAIAQDNANFFWDDTNERLGLGTNTPSTTLHASFNSAGAGVNNVVTIDNVRAGNGANNDGAAILFRSKDNAGNLDDMGRFSAYWFDSATGSEDSTVALSLRTAGAALPAPTAAQFRFDSGGNITITGSLSAATGGIVCGGNATLNSNLAVGINIDLNGSINSAAQGNIVFGGSLRPPIAAKTAAYTVLATDSALTGDSTTAAFTFSLETAVGCGGREHHFKRINGGANVITLDAFGAQTIDGAATATLDNQWSEISIKSDNANWLIMSRIV